MEGQSGVNLTSTTISSHLHELESSGIKDCDAMTNPPPTVGGLEAGAQESPSTSDVKLEDDVVLPDKGKGKQCLMTLPKEDHAMIHLETEKEHIILRDEMKVMIAHDHTQCVTV